MKWTRAMRARAIFDESGRGGGRVGRGGASRNKAFADPLQLHDPTSPPLLSAPPPSLHSLPCLGKIPAIELEIRLFSPLPRADSVTQHIFRQAFRSLSRATLLASAAPVPRSGASREPPPAPQDVSTLILRIRAKGEPPARTFRVCLPHQQHLTAF